MKVIIQSYMGLVLYQQSGWLVTAILFTGAFLSVGQSYTNLLYKFRNILYFIIDVLMQWTASFSCDLLRDSVIMMYLDAFVL